ncbi:formate hydrogenlyase [Sulfuriferula plumbiphila]|uniref:Formate hydrogenlyase n=1 Tax=Sulfuriferula plumbiphila TaxID=171865 RepID=A0A512LCC2_9PROT|nr:nickel-dependent hydrogenase large subunit [Sulfuriferula plumbiphila]BBP04785.1 formate hydrogenlyase [Sulfuriferula plumbiphila]GEP32133.1 formate hydrogenlyase [Sulfuriferula plumbiphila]
MNPCRTRIITVDQLLPEAEALHARGARFQMAWAERGMQGGTDVHYLVAPPLSAGAASTAAMFECLTLQNVRELPTLTHVIPLLGWYEREIMDQHGLICTGHPQPWPLLFHPGHLPRTPLLADAAENLPDDDAPISSSNAPDVFDEHDPPGLGLPEITGGQKQVQSLIWGPVRADVVETGAFGFAYVGELILHHQPRLFFKHRQIEARMAGRSADQGLFLAERVSGVGSVAHALAFAQAVETASGCAVPEPAHWLRVLLQELERLYNHLHYFGLLAKTTTLKVASAEGFWLEEQLKQILGRLTGSRFGRGLIVPGGLRRTFSAQALETTQRALLALRPRVAAYLARMNRTASHLDRLISTGVLDRKTALDQGATGPVERASGLDRDLRRDHPYAAWPHLDFTVTTAAAGDAQARAAVRGGEIATSFEVLERVLNHLLACEPEPVYQPLAAHWQGSGLGWVESPRGSLYYAITGADGRLTRVKIKSPSFSNWRVFPFTVHGSNMMDYAINEASFGLTIAGCDR